MRKSSIALGLVLAFLTFGPTFAKVSAEQYASLREDAFSAAQGTIVSAATDALSNVALRVSQSGGELGALVTKREDLIGQIGAHQKQLDASYNDKGPDAAANQDRIRKERSDLEARLEATDGEIATRFPAFAELTRPQPLRSSDVAAILKPDEALLLIVPGDDATYLFAVTREGFDWARSSMKESDLVTAVTALRAGLDVEQSSDSKPVPKFDRKTAFKLYQELVQPLEPLFKDKRVLFTATSGALQSLPLAVLVTAAPQGDDGDKDALGATHWLIDRYALVTLPAVSSLRTLRCNTVRDPAQRSTACPKNQGAETAPAAAGTLAFAGVGNPVLGPPKRDNRGGSISDVWHGEFADRATLLSMGSLPGTEKELTAIAAHYVGNSKLLVGPKATETNVKTDPDVARARILEFATHALIAGEIGRVGEPGLVFTPPLTPSPEDDGFLTASQAAQLHLSAEFVVLSACNTARRDGKLGADGLAGLARAFFYAGARAMLVSNWAVSDEATPVLMTGFFTTLEQDRKDGRAIAFQHAITDMKKDPRWAAPRDWAAFILVGDTDEAAKP